MHMPTRRDWSQGGAEAHLEVMRRASHADLPRLARSYDWSAHPGAVLGWVMAQRRIDLGTALMVFFSGDPERFNYLPKRDVPPGHRAAARLLDNICLRINSGFYLPTEHVSPSDQARIANWLVAQMADRTEGTSGRWALDEDIISHVMGPVSASNCAVAQATDPKVPQRTGPLAALIARLRRRRSPQGGQTGRA